LNVLDLNSLSVRYSNANQSVANDACDNINKSNFDHIKNTEFSATKTVRPNDDHYANQVFLQMTSSFIDDEDLMDINNKNDEIADDLFVLASNINEYKHDTNFDKKTILNNQNNNFVVDNCYMTYSNYCNPLDYY
jgi:hypothetical protein